VKRRLPKALAILSLLLCAATTGLWIRSYWVSDLWTVQWNRTEDHQHHILAVFSLQVCSTKGGVEAVRGTGTASVNFREVIDVGHVAGRAYPLIFQSMNRTISERLGFRFVREQSSWVLGLWVSGGTKTLINFPFWFPATVFATLPTLWLVHTRRRIKARNTNSCPVCGYDLRATPDRCPECGTVPKKLEVRI